MTDSGDVNLLARLEEQSLRWRHGERVLVEEYLSRYPSLSANADAALDLIGNEVLLRRELGDHVEVEEYLRRFPQWADQLKRDFEVERAIEEADSLPRIWMGRTPLAPPEPLRPVASSFPSIPGYEILGVLGEGGMGIVYRARQLGLGRMVALKMIRFGVHATAEELIRFRREAEAVARIQHPNIVQIFEIGEHGGLHYFSLELVEGPTLEKFRGIPQPARESAQLVEVLARAMHQAHLVGIVHRDLKPANVLLTKDGTPKIADFGLAKRLQGGEAHTQSGALMGTPAYMAPEQARGDNRRVGPTADVYALGSILYDLLTGRPPFQGDSFGDIVAQVLFEDPIPPSRLQQRVPRILEIICLKCLEKDSAKRYTSALELADDLGRYLASQPIHARQPGNAERLWRWCRRNPTLASVTAVAAVAILLLIVQLTIQIRSSQSRQSSSGETQPKQVHVQPRPNGPLLFEDTFDGRQPTAKPLLDGVPVTFLAIDGEGRLSGKGTADLPRQVMTALYDTQVDNFFADFHLELPQDCPPGSGFGLLFRTVRGDPGLPGYYTLLFFPGSRDTTGQTLPLMADLRYFNQGAWKVLKQHPWSTQRTFQVRLEAVGSQFRVFVNQTFLFEITDEMLPGPGLICLALVTANDKEVSKGVFRHLRVYRPGPE